MPGFYSASHNIIMITPAHIQTRALYLSSYHGSHEGHVQRDNRGNYFTSTRLPTLWDKAQSDKKDLDLKEVT